MNKQDDEQWLAALAGRPDPSADPATNAQANAMRSAMLARREQLERDAQRVDSGEFLSLQSRLKREGLLHQDPMEEQDSKIKNLLTWLTNLLSIQMDHPSTIKNWSLAANLVLIFIVAAQFLTPNTPKPESSETLRNRPEVVLRVTNPEIRLNELTNALIERKARYIVKRKPTGEIELLIELNDASIDYLIEQRIEIKAVDGIASVSIEETGL